MRERLVTLACSVLVAVVPVSDGNLFSWNLEADVVTVLSRLSKPFLSCEFPAEVRFSRPDYWPASCAACSRRCLVFVTFPLPPPPLPAPEVEAASRKVSSI